VITLKGAAIWRDFASYVKRETHPVNQSVLFGGCIIKVITILYQGQTSSYLKKKMAAHGDMGRHDEEDIEVCSRSIDLWGDVFIYYYNVACQAFFLFFPFLICFDIIMIKIKLLRFIQSGILRLFSPAQ
jgi:hypothetical protein